MNDILPTTNTRVIEAATVIPCAPHAIWKTLTTPELMAQWIKMPLAGFAPSLGNRFTFQTTPAGAWDGSIQCQIVELQEDRRLSYTWESGDEGNVGYGSRLNSLLTWHLEPTANGTRLGLTHSGFVLPKNEATHQALSGGWEKVIKSVGDVAVKVST